MFHISVNHYDLKQCDYCVVTWTNNAIALIATKCAATQAGLQYELVQLQRGHFATRLFMTFKNSWALVQHTPAGTIVGRGAGGGVKKSQVCGGCLQRNETEKRLP